jgi:hypothetical protein
MLFCLIGVVTRLLPPLFLHAFQHKFLVADQLELSPVAASWETRPFSGKPKAIIAE